MAERQARKPGNPFVSDLPVHQVGKPDDEVVINFVQVPGAVTPVPKKSRQQDTAPVDEH